MSLVAYEESDSEDEGTSYYLSRTCNQKELTQEIEAKTVQQKTSAIEEEGSDGPLHPLTQDYDTARLLIQDWNDKPRPPPLCDAKQSVAQDDEFFKLKKRKSIRIEIPDLKSKYASDEDEQTPKKIIKVKSTKFDLLELLPTPKNASSLTSSKTEFFQKLVIRQTTKTEKATSVEDENNIQIMAPSRRAQTEVCVDRHELLKSLTDPNGATKPVVTSPVNDTCRKRHHITYLAERAKANEQELQAQWSANHQARNQTRAKYGF